MSKIKWDEIGKRKYKTGVDHGVLYPQKNGSYPKGIAWNGLTTVNKSPSGAEDNKLYADNIQYLNMKSAETLDLTIECYFYPDEWAECNGELSFVDGVTVGQQRRNTFGFSYRTKIGNDIEGDDYGYEINLIYGCAATPSEQDSQTINDSPEAATFSYEVSTTPINVSGLGTDGKPYKPTACITIDSTKIKPELMTKIEDVLYGTDPTYLQEVFGAGEGFANGVTYYDRNGSVYTPTTDTTPDYSKSYYKLDTPAVPPSYTATTFSDGDSFSEGTTYYEQNGSDYEVTTDTVPNTSKTYYTMTNAGSDPVYSEVTFKGPDGFADGKTYYLYVEGEYVKTTDTSPVSGKVYYSIVKEGVDGRLPLPDELKKIIEDAAATLA